MPMGLQVMTMNVVTLRMTAMMMMMMMMMVNSLLKTSGTLLGDIIQLELLRTPRQWGFQRILTCWLDCKYSGQFKFIKQKWDQTIGRTTLSKQIPPESWKTHVFLYFISPLAQAPIRPRPTITGAREAGSQESWKVTIYLIFWIKYFEVGLLLFWDHPTQSKPVLISEPQYCTRREYIQQSCSLEIG